MICACQTRIPITIFIIIISAIATIYGIVVITQFASNLTNYKNFIKKLEELESNPDKESSFDNLPEYPTLDEFINCLGYEEINGKDYGY